MRGAAHRRRSPDTARPARGETREPAGALPPRNRILRTATAFPAGARSFLPAAAVLATLLAGLVLSLAGAAPATAQELTKRRGFSIKITNPPNQDFVLGKTKITAEVKIDKPEAVEKVEFFVGDTLIFIDTEAPYECFYDFGQESKQLVIRAVATHREGITVSDFVVTRKISMVYAVRVNRVVINASVFDKEGYFVTTLGKDDFTVFEKGVRQEIIDFQLETRPILMGILLDVSGSMKEGLEEVHQAAGGFVDTLRDKDRAMVVEFSEKVFMLSELSNDRAALKSLVESTTALGGTALYDAIHSTLRRLSKYPGTRKAMVLLTDGDDTASTAEYKKVLEEVKAGDLTVYTIALGGGFDIDSRGKLKELADETGGRYFSPGKASELEAVYQKIADELRNQYLVTYASSNEVFDGRWVPLKVEMKPKGLSVRHRQGYYAVPRQEP